MLPILMACHETLEERAAREAKEYTEKYCPAPITSSIVNDSMTFEPKGKTVHYYYSLRGEVDTIDLPATQIRTKMLDAVRNTPSLKAYKEAGFSFQYTYYSTKRKGEKLVDIKFGPKDYEK